MDMTGVLDLARETLFITLLISAPILIVGLVLGLIISIVQAVTQIQDQTIAVIPKIVAMVAATAFLVPWLAQQMISFSRKMFAGY